MRREVILHFEVVVGVVPPTFQVGNLTLGGIPIEIFGSEL